MATFTSLEADINIMRGGNQSYFDVNPETGIAFTQAQILAKFKAEAKARMKRDLIKALEIDQENTTELDATVDLNEQELKEALGYLQLHLIFMDLDDGIDSQARYKAEYNSKMYYEYKLKFGYINKRQSAESYNTTGSLTIG